MMRIYVRSIPRQNELGALGHRQRRLGEIRARIPSTAETRSALYAKWEPRLYERLVKVATLATIPQCPTVLLQRQSQVRRSDSTHE